MQDLTRTFEMVQEDANPRLQILGIFITKYDARSIAHREIAEVVRRDWQDKVFDTVLRDRKNILELVVEHKPIVIMKPSADVAKDYRDLAEEIIRRVEVR